MFDQSLLRAIAHTANTQRCDVKLVGGAVRDIVLGKSPHDYDIAVIGDGVRLARAMADQLHAAFYLMDAERGTARVILQSGVYVDFAQCRGTTWLDDLTARDFTVNAMALNLDVPLDDWRAALFDPLRGREDLQQRVIRQCILTSIADDPVRALRAVRMATMLDAQIESHTLAAARATVFDVNRTSVERLRDELMKMLGAPRAARAIQQMHDYGLLQQLLPEARLTHVAALDASPSDAQLSAQLNQVTTNERTRLMIFRLAVLLLAESPSNAARRAAQLKLSSDEVEQVRHTLLGANDINNPIASQDLFLFRLTQRDGVCVPEALWLAQLIAPHTQFDADSLIARYFEHFAPNVAPAPYVSGADVMALGVAAGPRIGHILSAVREAQMIGEIHSRDEALSLARQLSNTFA